MANAVKDYFATFADRFGRGWNQFWFTPSDPTVLGLVRALTGFLALCVVFSYTSELQRFFGPSGLLTQSTVDNMRGSATFSEILQGRGFAHWSYLRYCESSGALQAAHALGLGVLAAFALGLFSRITSVLALIVFVSYIHRAPILASDAESILAYLIVYLCLGPSGARWSVDRWLATSRLKKLPAVERQRALRELDAPRWSATVALRLIQVHTAAAYAMILLAQLGSPVWWDGTAVWWLIVRPDSALVDFTWLAESPWTKRNSDGTVTPWAINLWTHAITLCEACFALFAWNRTAAPLLIVAAGIMWLSVALISGQVLFAAAMTTASVAFWPPRGSTES